MAEKGPPLSSMTSGGKSSLTFWSAIVFTGIFSVWAVVNPENLTNTLWGWVYQYHGTFSWFTMMIPLIIIGICLVLAFSKFGNVKLGKKDEKPEFSTFSWLGMLFTAGIGVGLVNFGVAEPLVHYLQSAGGIRSGADAVAAAENAMKYTMFIWGLPAWSIYTISGLVIGYFAYSRGAKFLPGTPIAEGFSDKKWGKPLANITNILAAGASALTMAASIGLGVFQVKNAVSSVFGYNNEGLGYSVFILLAIFAIYTLAAVLPIGKGMKILGDINVVVAVAILVYVFALGNSPFLMNFIAQTFKNTFLGVVPTSLETLPFLNKGWFFDWPNTTLIWWISWTPFLGIFIARISKGRTIRQIIVGGVLAPVMFLIVWFSVFGGTGFLNAIVGDGSIIQYIQDHPDDVYLSFIMVLQKLPLFTLTGIVFIVLILVFLSTTATSSMISLSIITSNGPENAPVVRTLIWSVITTMVAFANVATGTLNGVRAIAVFLGIPYMFVFFLAISGLIRQLRHDARREGYVDPQHKLQKESEQRLGKELT
ncbi:BCCT family transporter [Paenibacillus alvei]|uniref:BCCT family transporter n=1 Tax=Paenibacillus alvei TaxID=44250 RepID=A0ABT4GZ10_PAEAL|nr:BCCT family transporter [Paenibacillus alvei]MCY7484611.1 BCCT family transporter [Paenibacillus alvei]MCY9544851.1 BCCT family transporter [Paenibacillus alvei]MCY9706194.1 BCCT family transporter [Paenibacillus alvei]MCY9735363.1 BCCT family transporter [Paenibacillus alvei]MCY9758597.1 BCCT family transporter [Paenibacillus alvei]